MFNLYKISFVRHLLSAYLTPSTLHYGISNVLQMKRSNAILADDHDFRSRDRQRGLNISRFDDTSLTPSYRYTNVSNSNLHRHEVSTNNVSETASLISEAGHVTPLYAQIMSALDQLLSCLKKIGEKRESDEQEELLVNEWKMAAVVIDRLMFWVFMIVTVVYTLAILVFVPVVTFENDHSGI